jgi:hypothetical protein
MKFGIGNRKNNGVGGRQQEEATGVRQENKAKGKNKKAKEEKDVIVNRARVRGIAGKDKG